MLGAWNVPASFWRWVPPCGHVIRPSSPNPRTVSTVVESLLIILCLYCIYKCIRRPHNSRMKHHVGIHYNDAIMSAMLSQITNISIAYSTFCSGADQRKHQSSASLALVRGIHRWPVNSHHKEPVTWKMFPFDDIIMFHFTLFWSRWPKPLATSENVTHITSIPDDLTTWDKLQAWGLT